MDDCHIWNPPFKDAADIIIDKILDRKTIDPVDGFSNEELMTQHDMQNEIMDKHEDYAALRAVSKSKVTQDYEVEDGKKKKRNARAKETISKIIQTETSDVQFKLPKPIPKACIRTVVPSNEVITIKYYFLSSLILCYHRKL